MTAASDAGRRIPLSDRTVGGPAAVLAAVAVFAGSTLILGYAFDHSTDHVDAPTCTAVSSTYVPPCPQQLSLVWILAASATLGAVLVVVVGHWRRDLVATFRDHPPGAGAWMLQAKRRTTFLGVLALAVAVFFQLPYGPNFDLFRSYGQGFDFDPFDAALVRAPIWLASLPVLLAVLSVLDVAVIAQDGRDAFLPVELDAIERLLSLRRSLDQHLWLLGSLLGLWVVARGAAADYAIAVAERAGVEGASALTAGTTTVVTGAVVTALLAILYLPAALAVDDLAAAVVAGADDTEAMTAEAIAARVGNQAPMQDRLYRGLSIAAPLVGAVVTTFLA